MEGMPIEIASFWASVTSGIVLWIAQRQLKGELLTFLEKLFIIAIGVFAGHGFIKWYLGIWPSNFTLSLDWYFSQLHDHLCAIFVVVAVVAAILKSTGLVKIS